jgi:hypothetical protein
MDRRPEGEALMYHTGRLPAMPGRNAVVDVKAHNGACIFFRKSIDSGELQR